MSRIYIGVAWPYANGSLHLGHVAGSLLPPDIFSRFHRMRGNEVLMVSGSDEHGTPITITADKQKKTPQQVVDDYHKEHVESLRQLGVNFDLFFRTSDPNHAKVVHDVFLRLLEKGYIYKAPTTAQYCPTCNKFLPDRYVEGTCPHCGSDARGDQCDNCGKTLDPTELKNPKCKLCGGTPETRDTEHFFLKLSALQPMLEEWLKDKKYWRQNVLTFTENWLKNGLKDRAITRDLQWGIKIPLPGYEGKRIYVWFEAVIGYLSASMEWARRAGKPDEWKKFWHGNEARAYYFIGKDNIPFHTIIWPAMLMGYGGLNLPYDVPANEFLQFDSQKFSKSKGIGIDVPSFLSKFDSDSLRYYLSINMPETKDMNFTMEDFIAKNNNELVAAIGNFIHRSISFTVSKMGDTVPPVGELDDLDRQALAQTEAAHKQVTELLEVCRFKDAMKAILDFAQVGNKYIDTKAPWKLVKEDKVKCGTALHVCLKMSKALAVMMAPFMPNAADKVWATLGYSGSIHAQKWETALEDIAAGQKLQSPSPIFKKIEMEKEALKEQPKQEAKPEAKAAANAPIASPRIAAEKAAPAPTVISKIIGKPEDYIDLRIAEVKEVAPHPNADKLYVLKINLGKHGERQLVAGIRKYYTPEELIGKKITVVANLEPAKLRGVESNGMILAAEDSGGVVSVLIAQGELGEPVFAEGSKPADAIRPTIKYDDFALAEIAAFADGSIKFDGKTLRTMAAPVRTERIVLDGANVH
ncbi:MAG: methionine--tRNA ligase [Candidatus Thermoplasmatota archaeon]|nr:methionine--tRNA ligase [Candidatus Thermoplasmatota archaeon]